MIIFKKIVFVKTFVFDISLSYDTIRYSEQIKITSWYHFYDSTFAIRRDENEIRKFYRTYR